MGLRIRLATFNVENLFTRPRLMNFKSIDTGRDRLEDVVALQRELSRKTYDAGRIATLTKSLKGYATIEAVRGKLFKGNRGTALAAKGAGDWDGFVRLTREHLREPARANTARVLREVDADVVCLVEVEDRLTLKHFVADYLEGRRYQHVMCIDGNDDRGIDVAIASRYPLGRLRSHVDDIRPGGREPIFSRDCLEVEVLSPAGPIHFLLNHLKSQGYGSRAANDARRREQAGRVAELLADYDLERERVVVCGDMNDVPSSETLRPLVATPHLTDVLEAKRVPPAERWTYHYERNEQIDLMLVSDPLRDRLIDAGVFRRGIPGVERYSVQHETSLPGMTDWTEAASDHGALWAEFDLG